MLSELSHKPWALFQHLLGRDSWVAIVAGALDLPFHASSYSNSVPATPVSQRPRLLRTNIKILQAMSDVMCACVRNPECCADFQFIHWILTRSGADGGSERNEQMNLPVDSESVEFLAKILCACCSRLSGSQHTLAEEREGYRSHSEQGHH